MEQWIGVAKLAEIPVLGSRVVQTIDTDIAVFRGTDDQVFAVRDACPHKNGPLSQGIMHDVSVTCPLHNWRINLMDGKVLGPDEGCVAVYPIKVEGGRVYLQLTPNGESEKSQTPSPQPLSLKGRGAKEKKHSLPLALRERGLGGEGEQT